MEIRILDVMQQDDPGVYRGGGRIMQILRENLKGKKGLKHHISFTASLDVVGENDTLVIPVWEPFQAPVLTRRIAKRQILFIFDIIPLKYRSAFPVGIKGTIQLWRNKLALSNYDYIITISEHSKREIISNLYIPSEYIKVVYPTYASVFETLQTKHDDSILSKYELESGKYCIYVGDVNWNKNIANIAKAISKADVTCAFVGKIFNQIQGVTDDPHPHPWLTEFKEFTSVCDEHAVFPGYVPDDELKVLYKHAMCNILISRDEGFGMSYLEASTQKCPSVLSDIPVFREIAGPTAMYVDPEDPKDIAKTLKNVKQLGAQGYERSKKYAPNIFVRNILTALTETKPLSGTEKNT